MNGTQVQASSATLAGVIAGYAAGQHWLGLDVNAWTVIIGALIVLWPAAITRLQALKNTVGKSGALVVTAPSSADATSNPNVVTTGQASAILASTPSSAIK